MSIHNQIAVVRYCLFSRAKTLFNILCLLIFTTAILCSGCARLTTTQQNTIKKFNIELHCGRPAPGADSVLAQLINYAEQHEGQLAHVQLEFYPGDCSCEQTTEEASLQRLQLICTMNPEWWLAKRIEQYHCVEALGLAGYNAGVGSICFPSHDSLPLKVGYARERTATHDKISGNFLLDWEWNLGAPHVALLIPE